MTAHPIDTEEARFGAEAHLRYGGGGDDLAENVLALLDALAAAEHRAARAEAQAAIRGRAVVMYRERAREAETDWDREQRNHATTTRNLNVALARIKAVRDVLDDLEQQPADQVGWDAAAILPDIRRALDGDA